MNTAPDRAKRAWWASKFQICKLSLHQHFLTPYSAHGFWNIRQSPQTNRNFWHAKDFIETCGWMAVLLWHTVCSQFMSSWFNFFSFIHNVFTNCSKECSSSSFSLWISKILLFGRVKYGWLLLNGVLHCSQQYFSHITATTHIIHIFLGFH